MNIIKEYCKFDMGRRNRIILRTSTYAHSFIYFKILVKEAMKDFPELKEHTIDVIHYGGQYYKNTYGIEFNINIAPPADYCQVKNTECTL